MSILRQLERDLSAIADKQLQSGEAPGPRRRGHRFGTGVAVALSASIAILVTLIALSLRHGSATSRQTNSNLVAVGTPVSVRSIESAPASGTLQLRAVGPTRRSHWRVLAALVRPIAREPNDVCFDVFAARDPSYGDVLCSVRGDGRLVAVIGQTSLPGARPLSYVVGQAPPGVTRVELLGLNGPHRLRLSAAHMFLATFATAARGRVALHAILADGRTLTTTFTLPFSNAQMQAFSDRYRRSGAVFNGEVDENIVGTTYRKIVRRFGPPLATLSDSHGTRCVYYDTVGYETGWSFCFKHGRMTSANGSQTAPKGVS